MSDNEYRERVKRSHVYQAAERIYNAAHFDENNDCDLSAFVPDKQFVEDAVTIALHWICTMAEPLKEPTK